MTQPSGSATMYGVLYQLPGTAHWAGKIRLQALFGHRWIAMDDLARVRHR